MKEAPAALTLAEATEVWARIGLLGFGGPAGRSRCPLAVYVGWLMHRTRRADAASWRRASAQPSSRQGASDAACHEARSHDDQGELPRGRDLLAASLSDHDGEERRHHGTEQRSLRGAQDRLRPGIRLALPVHARG